MDVELVSARKGGFVDPADVLHVVAVERVVFSSLLPRDLMCPFNAVLGLAGDGGNGAKRNGRSRGVHVKLALDA